MVDQVAGLTLGVDVSQVQQATKSLKEFKQANSETARSVEELAQSESLATARAKQFREEQRRTAEEAKKMRQEFQSVLGTIDPLAAKMNKLADASKVLDKAWSAGVVPDEEFFRLGAVLDLQTAKLKESQRALTAEGQAAIAAAAEKVAASKQSEAAARRESQARESANLKAQAASRGFIESLEDQVRAIGKTRTELLEMKAAQLGVGDQAAPLIAQLRAQAKQMNVAGLSAGQYSNALRILPMQITDVVTSLASGMPVWLVAIQQGGQIKDSFGGVGNTFKVLLSYLNPVTVAMGAVGAVMAAMGLAAYQAEKRQRELSQALILSGNYAGATIGQFNAMTDAIAESSKASGSSIREIANSLAASGKYTIAQIKVITKATADWANATGEDSSKITGYFEKIATDPVKGLAELNKQFNFLSVGQLTYIKKLEDTKGKTDAVSAATKIFADIMEQRVAKLADSATPLEKMWNDIKKWADDAWTTVGDRTLGALSLITDVVAGTVEQIRYLLNQGDIMIGEFVASAANTLSKIPGTSGFFDGIAKQQEEVVKNAKSQNADLLKSIEERNARIIKGEMGYVQASKQSAAAAQGYSKETKDAVDKEAEALKKKQKAQKVSVDQGDKVSEQYQADIIALQAQLKVLQEHRSVNDQISQQQKTYWNEVAKFQILEEAAKTRSLTKSEQQLLANKETILAYSRQKAEIGNMIVNQERMNKLQDDSKAYVDEMTAKRKALNDTISMGTREQERQAQLSKLETDWTAKGGSVDDMGLTEKKQALQEFFAEQDAQTKNWQAGLSNAFEDWGAEVTNVYKNVGQIGTEVLNGLSSQLTDFVMTGKANFGDFAKSIIADIIQMTIKMAIFNAIAGFMGGGTTAAPVVAGHANGGVVGNASFAGGGYTGDGGKYQPAGVVHKGEFVFTKEATRRLGVSNLMRLMRGYANGGPVGNTQSGGVTGGGGMTAISVGNVSIAMGGGMDKQNAKALESGVRQIVSDVLVAECSQGGRIYQLVKG